VRGYESGIRKRVRDESDWGLAAPPNVSGTAREEDPEWSGAGAMSAIERGNGRTSIGPCRISGDDPKRSHILIAERQKRIGNEQQKASRRLEF
jgi:hypothetical protein